MNDTITVCGIVATDPRHLVTETGIAITSMRLASPSRRWDRTTSSWVNGATNWYTVTAFRSLAANVHKSVKKGDRLVVTGRVRIRTWERDGRGGTSVEIDADALGHDLAWGISNWIRVPRHVGDGSAVQTNGPAVDVRLVVVPGVSGVARVDFAGPHVDGRTVRLDGRPVADVPTGEVDPRDAGHTGYDDEPPFAGPDPDGGGTDDDVPGGPFAEGMVDPAGAEAPDGAPPSDALLFTDRAAG